MSKSAYRYMAETFQSQDAAHGSPAWLRQVEWRESESFVRVERPLMLHRARALGYKAKQGVVMVRARVRRGGLRKKRFVQGRVPSKMGVSKITMRQNTQAIAEIRVAKHFPNLEVLNSYPIGEDGRHHYFEVILLDPAHPSIQADKDLNWICDPSNHRRVLRGKTAAGQRHRGLRWTGMGSEHTRPSVRKASRRDKDSLIWKERVQAIKQRL